LRWSEHGEHWLGAQFLVLRVISTRTRQLTLIQRLDGELQQFAQGDCSGLVASRPECALHGLPGRFGRCCDAAKRCDAAVGLLPAQSPDGLQQPFFFLVGPTTPLLLDGA